MKLSDIRCLHDLGPAHRAAQCLQLGAALHHKRKKAQVAGKLPSALQRESVTQIAAAPVLKFLHGIRAEEPTKVTGLSETGRTLATQAGEILDLVLTPQARKAVVRRALRRRKGESVEDLAVRQLALGMVDSSPVARICAAYAYWQATGAEAAVPVLKNGIASEDGEERIVAAHCLAHVDMKHVRGLHGTAKDDAPNTPANPVKKSMTVIIHGTFAKDEEWYKPGGDFHKYIKKKVYRDTYSAQDFFFWSGRYSLSENGLKKIWKQAAKKLVSWCKAHPARTLRLIAHSHGINVVNMATQMGLPACTLIQLSPPVRSWNLPQMPNVTSGRLFNVHSRIDLVVKADGGAQDYRGTAVASAEKTRIIAFWGHSDSHDPKKWAKKKVPALVRSVCP